MYVGSLDPAARCGKPCVWPQYGDAGGEAKCGLARNRLRGEYRMVPSEVRASVRIPGSNRNRHRKSATAAPSVTDVPVALPSLIFDFVLGTGAPAGPRKYTRYTAGPFILVDLIYRQRSTESGQCDSTRPARAIPHTASKALLVLARGVAPCRRPPVTRRVWSVWLRRESSVHQ